MSAESQSELKSFVKEICPDCDTNNNVFEKLKDLGVDTVSDLQYITADDVKDVTGMKPVHVRKMLSKVNTGTSVHSNQTGVSFKDTLVIKPLPAPTLSSKHVLNFNVNTILKEMPESLADIENGRRVQVDMRRKFVRECVNEVRKVTEHCSKKEFEKIAQSVVSLYPGSFEDRIGEVKIGTGYDSLLKQLVSRNENLNRSPSKCRKSNSKETEVVEVTSTTAKKRKSMEIDCYGCINWGPKLTAVERESQENMRKELQNLYGAEDGNWTKVYEGMEQSYALLREHINDGISLEKLLVDWPFFLQYNVVLKHCELLLGLKILNAVESAYLRKAPLLLRYLRTNQTDLQMAVFLNQLKEEKDNDNQTAILQGLILCLQKCFGEEETSLMFPVDEMASNEEIEAMNVKSWPRLAMLGENSIAAKQFALLVDKRVIDRYSSFPLALSMLFGSFYMLNIEYPVDAAATLEFIQRCFVGINPRKGVKSSKKQKASCVDSRVLKFINKLSDFQWME